MKKKNSLIILTGRKRLQSVVIFYYLINNNRLVIFLFIILFGPFTTVFDSNILYFIYQKFNYSNIIQIFIIIIYINRNFINITFSV